MAVHFVGVRHHSPACARLVARAVAALRPAWVLVEGPADMNPRLDELLLGHRLPIAVFSHYRDQERTATSWTPLCDYSPEWAALRAGREAGAEVRFIDLPAWHPAFVERAEPLANRYADAEARYAEATSRLRARFGADSTDALWDQLFELGHVPGESAMEADAELARRLAVYFELVRGDAEAEPGDRAREEYMASWVRAAAARADERPVLVVTGGFHTPALRALVAGAGQAASLPAWPSVPQPPAGALGGSFLVPYSFRQLDAFAGYQSGMPSPGYYQLLWEHGPVRAADLLTEAVAGRLRQARLPVSTADLIAARTLTRGLAALRGHPVPARTDVLDGMAGALLTEALEQPLPWTGRGPLQPGTDPAVVAMVAASTGERTGCLHPDTPVPPLVDDVAAHMQAAGVELGRAVAVDLADPQGLRCGRLLHRLRVLGVPGHERTHGPRSGEDPVFTERWEPTPAQGREAALIEAGAYGAGLAEAAASLLAERAGSLTGAARGGTPDAAVGELSGVLFDAVLCGADALSAELLESLAARTARVGELGALGAVLATALQLWRHDRVYGLAGSPALGRLVDEAVTRVFWLAEGLRGQGGVDFPRLRALVAARDALRHAEPLLTLPRGAALATAGRIAADAAAPADLRGAATGLLCCFATPDELSATRPAGAGTPGVDRTAPGTEVARQARELGERDPETLGAWLAGLFAVARDEVVGAAGGAAAGAPEEPSLLDALDEIVVALSGEEFLVGLPALRQAFAFFPPRERERIAERLLHRRGGTGSARSLLRTSADPLLLARARALEENVSRLLDRHGLRTEEAPA